MAGTINFNIEVAQDIQDQIEESMTMFKAKESLKSMQEQSMNNKVSEMSLEEINAEISAYRQERLNA
ncbi:MAG: hypothetical protein FWH14_00790 [Oscillospiraceae bacterium]|nr:hypothetical protein [Oscillospiraceae bacterium]